MVRFSTEPSSPTSTTNARPGASDTNSMCFSRGSPSASPHASALRQARQQVGGVGQRVLDTARARRLAQPLVDLGGLVSRPAAPARAAHRRRTAVPLGGQAPGAGVRREDEPGVLEVRHDVAHGGRREVGGQDARDRARPHGLAGFDVGFDETPEDIARALSSAASAESFSSFMEWNVESDPAGQPPVRALPSPGLRARQGPIKQTGYRMRPPNDFPANFACQLYPRGDRHAEGTCLVKFGDTHVLCTATVEDGCRRG